MVFSFNTYALILIVFGIITIGLALFIFRKVGQSTLWFSLMTLANAIWSVGYGFELASTNLEQVLLFTNIEFIGIVTIPIFWFLFTLRFCGKESWYQRKYNIFMISVVPAISLITVWTNDRYHLYFAKTSVFLKQGVAMFNMTPGPFYYILTFYFYLLLACGCYLLFAKFKSSDVIYKRQNISIMLAALVPWLGNIAYLLGFRPMGFIDVTPFAFIITNVVILLSISKFKLFDIIPIAREKVLDLVQDGFLVVDAQLRVIDSNYAVNRFIPNTHIKHLIGKNLIDILPDQILLMEKIRQRQTGKIDLVVAHHDGDLFLEADIYFLKEGSMNNEFTIIKFHDFTKSKAEALAFQKQTLELEKLNDLKDRIFNIIAHDLRGPLINLSEVLKLVSSKQIDIDEFGSLSPALSKDINYTTDLLENILHWSRSQLKGFGIKKEFFDVRNTIINEINYHINAAKLKHIEIIHDVFPNHIVHADIIMFQIVIRNLINNAIKFCREGGEIAIAACYENNGFVKIIVSDNGIGMSEAMIHKLFKNQNVTTRGTFNEKGTGIGLMVCKDFIERNGGSIAVESDEGLGSRFILRLPAKT